MSRQGISMSENVFKNFEEYWHFTKGLSKKQRKTILNALPETQRKKLKRSYERGGWEDLMTRDKLNKMIDELKQETNIDLISLRCKIFGGKSICLEKDIWFNLKDRFGEYDKKHTEFIFGGIGEEEQDKVIFLYKEK
jgi:hypothetical protein